MPEQSKGKNARRPKPGPPSPPATNATGEAPVHERPSPDAPPTERRPAPARRLVADASMLREQPAVAYALAFALLALLLICAFSIYMAAN
jgi:hypothetical protein